MLGGQKHTPVAAAAVKCRAAGRQRPDSSGQGRRTTLKRPKAAEATSRRLPQQKTKEVLEMAAPLFIEEESGRYTARPRHPHNGYYAGDFFATSRSDSSPPSAHEMRRAVYHN